MAGFFEPVEDHPRGRPRSLVRRLVVIEGATGAIVHQEQITDFKPKDERKLEEYTDMFTDLYTLQNRLIGIFVPRMVQVKRALYNN